MACSISLESSLDRETILDIMEIDERLESTGDETDTRINLTSGCLLYGALGNELHFSLLGGFHEGSIAITLTATSRAYLMEMARAILCLNFKVDDSPF